MRSLEGANCADLPPFVIEKYFQADVGREPLRAAAAKAICGNCVVIEECRSEALNMEHLQTRGVIGGVNVTEVRRARRWRSYEEGRSDKAPGVARPPWLPMSEAAHGEEQRRLAEDPDEPGDYTFDSGDRPAVGVLPRPVTHISEPPTGRRPERVRPPGRSSANYSADVPMALDGANCAAIPLALIQSYFDSDVLREPAQAALAKLVCEHCVVLTDCRERALNASSVRESGVIAGVGARELRRGRAWRRYEAGWAEAPPRSPRPTWLPRTEAGGHHQPDPPTAVQHDPP